MKSSSGIKSGMTPIISVTLNCTYFFVFSNVIYLFIILINTGSILLVITVPFVDVIFSRF